jgi:DNA-binding FadR family transcriptional regulator
MTQAVRRDLVQLAVQTALSNRRRLSPLASELGERIVHGEIPPHTALSEKMFGPQRAVSRTNFREAIKLLEGKGLVTLRQGTGTLIAARDQWNMLDADVIAWRVSRGSLGGFFADFFALRRAVEPTAAESAARLFDKHRIAVIRSTFDQMRHLETSDPHGTAYVLADVAFHKSVLLASGNEFLVSLGHILEMPMQIFFSITNAIQLGVNYRINIHERLILEIEAGNPSGARNAAEEMLSHIGSDVRRVIEMSGEDEVAENRDALAKTRR